MTSRHDTWDPERYERFAAERGRPFADLLARVPAEGPHRVADLGCGTGAQTAHLARRWPNAQVHGVDSSPAMIARARERAVPGRLDFSLADLRTWQPSQPLDVIVSNAALHWVPDHLALLSRLVAMLAPGGWLAFQVPANFTEPTHTLMRELAAGPRWRRRLAARLPGLPSVAAPADYLDALARRGCAVDVWQTTYLHVLTGEDPVLEWMTGTGLRPLLEELDEQERAAFTGEYAAALRTAYPRHDYGTVLPYRRTFVVARTPHRDHAACGQTA